MRSDDLIHTVETVQVERWVRDLAIPIPVRDDDRLDLG